MFPGMTPHLLTLPTMFNIPMFRELWYSTGACSAARAGLQHLLGGRGRGEVAVLVPGGAPEALNSDIGEARLLLKNKKGFVKMAITCGADLVPTFSFGEISIYDKVRFRASFPG